MPYGRKSRFLYLVFSRADQSLLDYNIYEPVGFFSVGKRLFSLITPLIIIVAPYSPSVNIFCQLADFETNRQFQHFPLASHTRSP